MYYSIRRAALLCLSVFCVLLSTAQSARDRDNIKNRSSFIDTMGMLLTKAEQGDVAAMYALSFRYMRGNGIKKDSAEGIKWLEQSAKGGYTHAMNTYALLSRKIKPGEADSTSFLWLLLSAQLGNSHAMFNLGNAYMSGRGVEKDLKKGLEWMIKAAEAKHVSAMYLLASIYDNGRVVDKDTTQSLLWYTKAADAGHPDALNNLGIKYRRGRWVKKDYNKAMQLFKKSANAGNAYGMFNLGRMYEFGNGTKQDYKKAHEWYLKSVTVKPETGAAYRLGVFYEEGKGVQQDFTEAIRWYKTNIREPYSLHRLGNMYELGKGVTADKTEAVKWYNKAVEANSPFGMYYLGRFYEGENKLTIANDWYSKAYSLLISEIIKSIDNTEAMMVLAVMIETGKGTGKNIQQALSLYKHAAELGDEDAKVRVKQLEQ